MIKMKKLEKKVNKVEAGLTNGDFCRHKSIKVLPYNNVEVLGRQIYTQGEKQLLEILPHSDFRFIYKVSSPYGEGVFQRTELLEMFYAPKKKKRKKNKNKKKK